MYPVPMLYLSLASPAAAEYPVMGRKFFGMYRPGHGRSRAPSVFGRKILPPGDYVLGETSRISVAARVPVDCETGSVRGSDCNANVPPYSTAAERVRCAL